MFPKAAEYLQPIQNFARLCCTFPDQNWISGSTISNIYLMYSLFILLTSASLLRSAVRFHMYFYSDVILLTLLLCDVMNFAFHVCAVLIPKVLSKSYSKLLASLRHTETLIHEQNMSQTQSPQKCLLYVLMTIESLGMVAFAYITHFIFHASLIDTIGMVATMFTVYVCMIHILSILLVIKNKFIIINWHLEYLNNKLPAYLLPSEAKRFIQNKIHAKNVADKFVVFDSNARQVTAQKIKAFNQIHFLLVNCTNLVSKYFSLQIFCCVVCTALQIMCISIAVFVQDFMILEAKIIFAVFTFYDFILVFSIGHVFHNITREVSIDYA